MQHGHEVFDGLRHFQRYDQQGQGKSEDESLNASIRDTTRPRG